MTARISSAGGRFPEARARFATVGSRGDRARVLFVGEAVTLAHVARPLVLAESLDPGRYDVHFACADSHAWMVAGKGFAYRPIRSIGSRQFLHALARGKPVYDYRTLLAYVEEDLGLLDAVRPDIVVGDFRLSLGVSAPLCNVPYVTVTNAYWSPYARADFPLPEIPLVRVLGVKPTEMLFRAVRPLIFALHTKPMNRVRARYGLKPLGDLTEVYTAADQTLFADVPGLVPTEGRPPNVHYLGPVLWSSPAKLPGWWDSVPADRPCVYVTFGSSGDVALLPKVIEALLALPVSILVATAGRCSVADVPGRLWCADYLPGDIAARSSALVICNGGSPTAYQALAGAVPVLGIPSNMDQYLAMGYVARAGAGLVLRSGQATGDAIRLAAARMLAESSFRQEAGVIAREFARNPAPERFRALMKTWLPVPDVQTERAPASASAGE
jgi:UDP:flavonoid glycosyltransferase YjiC (YdhE family)